MEERDPGAIDLVKNKRMAKSFAVVSCTNRANPGSMVSFHRITANQARKLLWIQAINRKKTDNKTVTWVELWAPVGAPDRVCGAHFTAGKPMPDSDRSSITVGL